MSHDDVDDRPEDDMPPESALEKASRLAAELVEAFRSRERELLNQIEALKLQIAGLEIVNRDLIRREHTAPFPRLEVPSQPKKPATEALVADLAKRIIAEGWKRVPLANGENEVCWENPAQGKRRWTMGSVVTDVLGELVLAELDARGHK